MDAPVMQDTAADVVVVDVSAGPAPTDAADLIQVCYGTHRGACHLLGESAGGKHGVVISLNATSASHRAFLDQYRRILRAEIPLRVVGRPPAVSKPVGHLVPSVVVDPQLR